MSGNSVFIISLILSPPVKTSQLTKYLSANCVISYLTGPMEWQRASLVAQTVKNLPAMRETWVWSLGWEDPLEEGMATHSHSCLENPHGQRSLADYSPWCHKESDTTEQLSTLEWQEGICKLFVGRVSAYVIIRELDKAENIKSKNLKRQWGQGDACSVVHSCPTLWDPMDCSLLGSSVHGVFQARILDWVAISFSRGYSWFRDWTRDSCIGRWLLYHWATWEAHVRWWVAYVYGHCPPRLTWMNLA